MDKEDSHIWHLITKRVNGELTLEESAELDQLLTFSEKNRELLDQVKEVWEKAEDRVVYQPDIDAAWSRVSAQINLEDGAKIVPMTRWKAILSIAASVLVILSATIWIIGGGDMDEYPIVYTSNSEPLDVKLTDGSRVTMSPNSEISIEKDFGLGSRNVTLKGEAFFIVQPDSSQPFIVSANDAFVRVLGTSFLVTVNDAVRVEVATGKVEVASTVTGLSKIIRRGEVLAVSKEGDLKEFRSEDINRYSSLTRLIEFDDMKMIDVCELIQEYFGRDVLVRNESINECRFTGYFENPSLEDVLQVIRLSSELEIYEAGDTIIISGKGCN